MKRGELRNLKKDYNVEKGREGREDGEEKENICVTEEE